MNDTYTFQIENYTTGAYLDPTPAPPTFNIVLEDKQTGINYTELGIFISGLILSLGGCIAVVCSQLRKSNCSYIKCFCLRCDREDLDISD